MIAKDGALAANYRLFMELKITIYAAADTSCQNKESGNDFISESLNVLKSSEFPY